jgi:hypothetical protein
LKNLSRRLKLLFLGSSDSPCLKGRSVASIDPLPGMREAEAKAVLGGPSMISSAQS